MNRYPHISDNDFGRRFLLALDELGGYGFSFSYVVRKSLRHADREGVLGILSCQRQGLLYATIQVARNGSPEELAAEWKRLMKVQERLILFAFLLLAIILLLR